MQKTPPTSNHETVESDRSTRGSRGFSNRRRWRPDGNHHASRRAVVVASFNDCFVRAKMEGDTKCNLRLVETKKMKSAKQLQALQGKQWKRGVELYNELSDTYNVQLELQLVRCRELDLTLRSCQTTRRPYFAFLHISVFSFRHYIRQFICTLSRLMRCKHGKVFGNCWKKTIDRSRDSHRNTDLSIARTWTINQSIISYDSRLKTWLINLQRAGESSIIQLSGLDLPSLFRSFYQSILNLPPQTPT